MNGTSRLAGLAIAAALCLALASASGANAVPQTPAGGQDAGGAKPAYTMAEYNAYTAAKETKDPTTQIKQLDDFVSKYPNSALLIYVYPLYYQAYNGLKNYPKVIENADKLLALGDKAEPAIRYQAYYARAFAYTNMSSPPADQATKARQAALDGLKTVNELKAPANMPEQEFEKQKQPAKILFNYTAA